MIEPYHNQICAGVIFMKTRFLIIAVMSVCLLLGGCEQARRMSSSSLSLAEVSQSSTTDEIQKEYSIVNVAEIGAWIYAL